MATVTLDRVSKRFGRLREDDDAAHDRRIHRR